jgi:hypothetical protein
MPIVSTTAVASTMPAESATPTRPRPRSLESAPCDVHRATSQRVIAGEDVRISRSGRPLPSDGQTVGHDLGPNDRPPDGGDMRRRPNVDQQCPAGARFIDAVDAYPMRFDDIRSRPDDWRLAGGSAASTVPISPKRDCDAAAGPRRPSSNGPSPPVFSSASPAGVATAGRRHASRRFA